MVVRPRLRATECGETVVFWIGAQKASRCLHSHGILKGKSSACSGTGRSARGNPNTARRPSGSRTANAPEAKIALGLLLLRYLSAKQSRELTVTLRCQTASI